MNFFLAFRNFKTFIAVENLILKIFDPIALLAKNYYLKNKAKGKI